MTWIKTIRPEDADPSLLELLQKTRAMYPPEYATPVTSVAGESIVASHTLIPQAMHHAFALLAVLMQPGLPLERKHHEMIATVVSVANRCFF
jgi:hypothetical protein